MLPGETIGSGASNTCSGDEDYPHERVRMVEAVQSSGGGYYIGTFCPYCGPYSRESGYYRTADEAQAALDSNSYGRA